MDSDKARQLRDEVVYLHQSLFGRNADAALVTAYLQTHEALPELNQAPAQQKRTIEIIMARQLDVAAIEPWLRRKEKRHLLTAKLLLIAYIAECDGRHHEFDRRQRKGKIAMLRSLLIGGLLLLKGHYQKMRYGLV